MRRARGGGAAAPKSTLGMPWGSLGTIVCHTMTSQCVLVYRGGALVSPHPTRPSATTCYNHLIRESPHKLSQMEKLYITPKLVFAGRWLLAVRGRAQIWAAKLSELSGWRAAADDRGNPSGMAQPKIKI